MLPPLGPSTPWKGMAEPETMILPIAYTIDRLRMVLDIHVCVYVKNSYQTLLKFIGEWSKQPNCVNGLIFCV